MVIIFIVFLGALLYLILEINNVEVANINDVTLTEGGLVGLGAMSSEILPAVLNYEYLLVRRP